MAGMHPIPAAGRQRKPGADRSRTAGPLVLVVPRCPATPTPPRSASSSALTSTWVAPPGYAAAAQAPGRAPRGASRLPLACGADAYTRNRARSAPRSAAVVASWPYICHATAARAAASPASSAASRLAYKAFMSAIPDHLITFLGLPARSFATRLARPGTLPGTAAADRGCPGEPRGPAHRAGLGRAGRPAGPGPGPERWCVCVHRGLLGTDLEARPRPRRRLGLIMVPRFGPAGVQPAHGDQAEPEVADFGQQPVQRGLVSDQAAEDRLLALAAELQAVEPGGPPVIQDTRHADLIPGRLAAAAHPSSSRRPAAAAQRAMPGGADRARGNDPRLACQARAGLRAAIAVRPAGCVSFMC